MPSQNSTHLSIKDWADDDRPREKLVAQGAAYLSDAELLAILLRSGSRGESAVSLAKRVLKSVDANLDTLAKVDLNTLTTFKGLGEAKAITILAALELGRRRESVDPKVRPRIMGSMDIYHMFAARLRDLPHEEAWLVLLDRKSAVMHQERLSTGGAGQVVFDIQVILRKAIEKTAAAIVLVHNHPSGDPAPSTGDHCITRQVNASAALVNIKLGDHVIIAGKTYFSFKDEKLIRPALELEEYQKILGIEK